MNLNCLSQSFCISLSPNWIYPEVSETFLPVLRRTGTPFDCLDDFMNANITAMSFPSFASQTFEQMNKQRPVQKRGALSIDKLADKSFTLTFKCTESYLSYFIMVQQFDWFLKVGNQELTKPLYMGNIVVSLIDDMGFETMSYIYKDITMSSIGGQSLSYSARIGTFNTFDCGFKYNDFDMCYRSRDGKTVVLNNPTYPDFSFIKQGQVDLETEKRNSTYTSRLKDFNGQYPKELNDINI